MKTTQKITRPETNVGRAMPDMVGRTHPTVSLLKIATLAIAACFSPLALANPIGPVVVNGAATVVNNGNTTTVTNTPGAILNWQQFSIGQGQTTQFNQQSAQSSVLNRVTGPDASQILGTLRSNGQVFLINPNGIMFGAGSVIDVNRLIASTLNITNADFLANNLKFNGNNNGTSVVNQGTITTPFGGSVYLIGNNVTNQGVITTPQGDVVLAAGNSVSMVNTVTPHVSVTVTAGGQALNLGQVTAQGGSINIYGALVQQQGIVNANSASVNEQGSTMLSATQSVELAQGSSTTANGATGGNITIQSGATGSTTVAGAVEAIGSNGTGGNIQVLGNSVALTDSARLDASGTTGGGSILMGGDYQGKNAAVQNALTTNIAQGATLKADATLNGNGGKIIAWSDSITHAYGSFSAKGGAQSGNGGLIETSGHYLDVAGIRINAAALNGAPGTWLLDPIDVTITAGTNNGLLSGSSITDGTINQALNTGTNVTISTSCCGGTQPGGIVVSGHILKSTAVAAPTLTLNADGTIDILSGGMINSTNNGLGNGLNVTLNGLAVWINGGGVYTSSGNFTINSTNGAGILGGGVVNTANGNVNISAKHFQMGSPAVAMSPATTGAISAGNGTVAISTTSVSSSGYSVAFEAGSEVLASSLTINGTSVTPGLFSPTRTWAPTTSLNLASIFGTYSGTYTTTAGGTGSGTWTMIVSANGAITLTHSGTVNGVAQSGSGTGQATVNATISGSNTDGATWSGSVNAATGTLTGTWSNSGNGTSGTFSSQLTQSQVTQVCLLNPTLCASSPAVKNLSTATTASTASVFDTTKTTGATGDITYSAAQPIVVASIALTYNDIRQARSETRKADDKVEQAEKRERDAKTPEAKRAAHQDVVAKSNEADAKRAEAKIREAESELRAAEAEVKSAKSPQEKVRAEARKAVAEAKRAEGEVDKATAEAKLAEAEAKGARTPEAKAAAEVKKAAAEVEVKKAEVKKVEVDARKAETELKQAEAEARTSGSSEAKAVVEAKKAEIEAKKVEAEIKKTELEAKSAKDPAAKAAAETKLAKAEAKKAEAEAKKAEAEAKQADAEAKKSDSPVAKQLAEVKKADAEAKKAEVEVKSTNDPERKAKAEVKVTEAEAKKADAEAKKAEAEVKVAEVKAKNSNKAEDKKDLEDKKVEAEVKKADAEVKKTDADAKKAKGVDEKKSAEAKHKEAEVKHAEAEVEKAEHEAKRDNEEAKSQQSGYTQRATIKKAEASAAKVELKKAELEAKQAQTPEARAAAEKRVASLKAEVDTKETEFKDAKRSSDSKIIEVFGGMALASTAKERVQEAMVARHEFMKETLKPALNILKADPHAADLKPCGAGGGDVCMRPVNPALTNLAGDILPRVQLPVMTPTTSFLPGIQRKVAVVIGNNAYQDPNIPALNGAINDADAIGKIFQEKMGYDVRVIHNGTRADIVRTINQISDETGSKDSVVVYYAGHGYQMEDTKVGYWIPSDASVKDPSKWISNSDINKMLANIPAKQMILVSDSCFSGALTSEQKVASGSTGKNVDEILDKRSVLVMSSGGEEPVLDEGKDGHSIFAWHLMDKLGKVDQYENGSEMFTAVKDGVVKDAAGVQTPQYGASTSAGHMKGGDYLFEVRKY